MTCGNIREHDNVLYLAMAMEFTIVINHPDNGHRSYKPQTKRAERMILPGSSQNTCEHTFEYARAEKQLDFVIFLLLLIQTSSIAYKLKQLLSYFTHRMTLLSCLQWLQWLHNLHMSWTENFILTAMFWGYILYTSLKEANPPRWHSYGRYRHVQVGRNSS